MPKVVILGGGVAGMSAAHELVERGFEVEVYELRPIPGGKARSISVPGSGKDGRANLMGEHGLRFFPSFYRHLPDTMKRIAIDGTNRTVYDNFVEVTRVDVARFGTTSMFMLPYLPHSLEELRVLYEELFVDLKDIIQLREGELTHFAECIWQVLTSCETRRTNEYEKISWWDFIGAETRSEGYQRFLAQALTQTLAAARAKLTSTKTQGDIVLQMLFDMVRLDSADRILNGPTQDAWITPWYDYLQRRGVRFNFDSEVVSINCLSGRIANVTLLQNGIHEIEVGGDYFLAALPVEVMATLIERPPCPLPGGKGSYQALIKADPTLVGTVTLGKYVAWMNGIQYYLKTDVPITSGHTLYLDSPWALVSISQHQFWPNIDFSQYGDGTVRGILSVVASDWTTPGVYHKKPANECTPQEIAEEIWEQLKLSLNVDGRVVLSDAMQHSWFLDPDLRHVPPGNRTLIDSLSPSRVEIHDVPLYDDAEPLFIALVDTWHLRPNTFTRIPNLFLAADYVVTNTQLATMEAANEAARRAVNNILEASGSREEPCKVWELHEPGIFRLWRWHDSIRYRLGLPWSEHLPWPIATAQRLLLALHRLRLRLSGTTPRGRIALKR
ncbi:MAG: FAD-dependent oxidoreductase [bacterium]|nr:FAD-dependent oxidoreductase [bacterium]